MASVRASDDGLKIIEQLRIRKGWKKDEQKWIDKSGTSEPSLKRFWQKKSIRIDTFAKICKAVDQNDWEAITEEFGDNKPRKLKEILYSLNYQTQSRLFEDFWNGDATRKLGCFLVHGKNQNGQELLVNRLFYRDFPNHPNTPHKFTINLPNCEEIYIEKVWQILGEKLRCSPTITDIVEMAYNYWREETVVLTFKNLDRLYITEHQKLLEQFWMPLVDRIAGEGNQKKFYFLLFLVDNRSRSSKWDIDCCQIEDWHYYRPLDLKAIENFSRDLLSRWLEKNKDRLGELMANQDIPNILEQVWYNSREEGIPELAIREICAICGCSWDNIQNTFDL